MSDAAFFRTTLVMVTLLSLRSASGAKRKDTFEKRRSMGMTTGAAPAGSVMPDRVTERCAEERKHDFLLMENSMTLQQAYQEASRCLRCDKFGYGALKGGRIFQW